jgi:hypothetical protein
MIDPMYSHDAISPSRPEPLHYRGFTIILRHTTVVKTSIDKWSAPSRDLYLTTHNIHTRQTFMPSVGFETPVPASERPRIHAWDRSATGTGDWPYALQPNTWLVPCLKFPPFSGTSQLHDITTNFHTLAGCGRSFIDFINQLCHKKVISFNEKRSWLPLTVQITRVIR